MRVTKHSSILPIHSNILNMILTFKFLLLSFFFRRTHPFQVRMIPLRTCLPLAPKIHFLHLVLKKDPDPRETALFLR